MKQNELNHNITVHVSKEYLENIKIEKDLFDKKWYQNGILLFFCQILCWCISSFAIIYFLRLLNLKEDYWLSNLVFGVLVTISIVAIIYLWIFYKRLFDNIYYLQRNKFKKTMKKK